MSTRRETKPTELYTLDLLLYETIRMYNSVPIESANLLRLLIILNQSNQRLISYMIKF